MNYSQLPGGLIEQIAYLEQIDMARVEQLRHEAITASVPWIAEYGGYQSGGWWTASLMNATGIAADVTIHDCIAKPTELLEHMPATSRLLAELGLSYMWVRLAWLEPNAFLWEHRDYGELHHVERHRLHLPLQTNSSAFLVTGGTKIHMPSGGIWRLAPSHAHGICNLLGPARIHLIADVYPNDAYYRLAEKASLHRSQIESLPTAPPNLLNDRLVAARRLASLGFIDTAERLLLRLFYSHALPEGTTYDLIAQMHEKSGEFQTATRWRSRKNMLLGLSLAAESLAAHNKEKEDRTAQLGTQCDVRAAEISTRPQLATRLTEIFSKTTAITHLLLGGAIGADNAVSDAGDLNLILGVADAMMPAIYGVIDDLMRIRADALLPGWHDRRAVDPDVLRFVFLLPDNGILRLVNIGLVASSRIDQVRQRITTTELLERLPAKATQAARASAAEFIARHASEKPSCTDILVEYLVLAVLLHNRVRRGLPLLPIGELGVTAAGQAFLADLEAAINSSGIPAATEIDRALERELTRATVACPQALAELADAITAYHAYRQR